MAFLYGRAGRLTAENGDFRPGQCFTIGAVVGILLYLAAWLVFLLDFRASTLNMRRGVLPPGAVREQVNAKKAATLIGVCVSNGLLSYLVTCMLTSLLVFPFTWYLPRTLLWDQIASRWQQLLLMLLPTVAMIVLKMVLTKKSIAPKWGAVDGEGQGGWYLKNPVIWSIVEVLDFYLQIVVGIVKAIVRFVTAIVVLVVGMPRVERSLLVDCPGRPGAVKQPQRFPI